MVVDGYEFKCTMCGLCCEWNGYVVLNDDDINRLSSYEGLSVEEFKSNFTKTTLLAGNSLTLLKDKPNSNECIYLKDKGCSVHDIKPKQCKDYPLKYEEDCEGFITGDKSMRDTFAEAIKKVNRKLAGDNMDASIISNLYTDLKEGLKASSVVSKALESGMDVFLYEGKIKLASLDDLYAFEKMGSDQLVHRSTKDLWSIEAGEDGSFYINRLFDDTGKPLKA